MKQVVWKAYYNYEKEENWLKEMSAKGMALISYSWCRYVLEDIIVYYVFIYKTSCKKENKKIFREKKIRE